MESSFVRRILALFRRCLEGPCTVAEREVLLILRFGIHSASGPRNAAAGGAGQSRGKKCRCDLRQKEQAYNRSSVLRQLKDYRLHLN
jgi:hypothetical protein